jgi:hypothetical protein
VRTRRSIGQSTPAVHPVDVPRFLVDGKRVVDRWLLTRGSQGIGPAGAGRRERGTRSVMKRLPWQTVVGLRVAV